MTKLNKWLVTDDTAQAYKDGKADGYSQAEKDYFAQSQKDREDTYNCGYAIGRAEAIDELLERFIEMLIKGDVDVEDLRKLAEQLKSQN